MRGFCYLALVLGMLLIPVERNDVGKLRPVEAISIYKDENEITIETDTEDTGKGKTVEEALKNLVDTTAGIIYIDTAEYLLVETEELSILKQMSPYVKRSVKVCAMEGRIEPEEAAVYLQSHPINTTIKTAERGKDLPVLAKEAGKLTISNSLEKDEKSA